MESATRRALMEVAVDENVALYFPYSRVPESDWFTKVLLYWDRAASIVPDEHVSRAERYQSKLAGEGLLEYLSPRDMLRGMGEQFVPTFLGLVDQWPVHYEHPHLEYVYASKLPRELLEALADRQLAEPAPEVHGRGEQWRVDVETADAYMAYLASAVSWTRPGTAPVTDHEASLATLGLPRPGHQREELERLRYAVVTAALPTPSRAVPPIELRAFKDKHRDALRRCRWALDEKLADLAMVDEPYLRHVKTNALIETIADEVAVLQEDMAKRRWPKVTKVSVGGIVAAALGTTAQLAGTTHTSALWLLSMVGAGVAQAGPAAFEVIQTAKTPTWNPRAPMAYAALTSRL